MFVAIAELVVTFIADTLTMLYGVFFATNRRDMLRSYLLLVLVGFIGVHRLNLAHYWTGGALFVGFPTFVLLLDWAYILAFWAVIVAVDAFLLPGMVRAYNARVDAEDRQARLEDETEAFR